MIKEIPPIQELVNAIIYELDEETSWNMLEDLTPTLLAFQTSVMKLKYDASLIDQIVQLCDNVMDILYEAEATVKETIESSKLIPQPYRAHEIALMKYNNLKGILSANITFFSVQKRKLLENKTIANLLSDTGVHVRDKKLR